MKIPALLLSLLFAANAYAASATLASPDTVTVSIGATGGALTNTVSYVAGGSANFTQFPTAQMTVLLTPADVVVRLGVADNGGFAGTIQLTGLTFAQAAALTSVTYDSANSLNIASATPNSLFGPVTSSTVGGVTSYGLTINGIPQNLALPTNGYIQLAGAFNTTAAAVPEPTSAALLLVGLVGIAACKRSKKQSV